MNGRDRNERRSAVVWLWGFAIALAANACTDPGDEFIVSSAVVYGTVTRAGAPFAGARVYPYATLQMCREPSVLAPVEVTGADGRYRQVLRGPVSPQTGCLLVRVLYSNGDRLDSVTVRDIPIPFNADDSGNLDSVRVDVALP